MARGAKQRAVIDPVGEAVRFRKGVECLQNAVRGFLRIVDGLFAQGGVLLPFRPAGGHIMGARAFAFWRKFLPVAIAEGKEIFIMRKAGELPAFEFEQSAVAFEELRGVDVARFSQA